MELYLLFLLVITVKAEWDFVQWKIAWEKIDWKNQMFFVTDDEKVRCYSCTSINASEIVDGNGIHPGFYLTSLLAATIPVTNECFNPVRLRSVPVCDDGLCVKINYTSKSTGRMDILRACLPRSKGVFKQVCTEFKSSQAQGNWCVCSDNKCNSSPTTVHLHSVLLLLSIFATAVLKL